ncbi:MAG: hypothetical protein COA91_04000 [Robiginitomaculum sp.]|nr:MAG: hypothetical protein COA91_04000 [Robiginitomaculum sp.]
MHEKLKLRSSLPYLGPFTLSGATALSQVEKDQFRRLYDNISMQKLILESGKFWGEFNKVSKIPIINMIHPKLGRKQDLDIVLIYYQRELQKL